jgi:hypothetical protein
MTPNIPEIHAVGLTTSKARGEAAEAAFLDKAARSGDPAVGLHLRLLRGPDYDLRSMSVIAICSSYKRNHEKIL